MSDGVSLVWRRSAQRGVHLLLAIVLGTSVYSPLSGVQAVELLVQFVVFPALALSGVLLWKGPVVRRRVRRRRSERT